jgi:stage II sporulation protein D
MHETFNRIYMIVFCLGFIALLNCTPNPIYRQYHPSDHKKSVRKPPVQSSAVTGPTVDSAISARKNNAPDSDARQNDTLRSNAWGIDNDENAAGPPKVVENASNAWHSDGPRYHAPSTMVRVVLRQNAAEVRIVSSGPMTTGATTLRGGATIERGNRPGVARYLVDGGEKREVALPCTLYSGSEFNIVKIEEIPYRGSVIIAPDGPAFSIVNYVAVEDYLRGVVPLEVGRGNDEVLEAVKAQAVAARTYTCRKMQENRSNPFDVSATVSDQVYGGVAAESEVCNRAIRATAGEIMVYRDSLIYAYYHSTCGGRTANIEDVWSKSALPYLRSVDDGTYCSQSGSFSWEEVWPLPQFSYIVNKYSRDAFPQNPCRGEVKDISLESRFGCGRTKQLTIWTSDGVFAYGGDKIRFALRRNTSGFPILKSSLITDVSVHHGTVVIKGRGYGHGVGMCQMGALGRAKRGQDYNEIVKAYYTGIEIKKIATNK